MVEEDYVSFEVAKLLKEKGFKEWCRQCYGLDVRHNGEPIDFDEECELKDAGRENEIEYVDGGRMYDYGCGNFNPGSLYAAPSLYAAMKWLREVHKLFIFISPWIMLEDNIQYYFEIREIKTSDFETLYDYTSKELNSFEKVAETAIKYCLENLI